MIYVFSDGSVASDGTVEMVDGVGKGVWSGDNSSTAASFFLVYDPAGAPQLLDTVGDTDRHQQLGWMRPDASVDTASTPAANNVNLNVEMVILNYMALHGQQNLFAEPDFFPAHGLGSASARDRYVAFAPLASINGGVLS
jgi:hypothetical protein